MSSNVRSFFRSNRSRNKTRNIKPRQNSQETTRIQRLPIIPSTVDSPLEMNDWIPSIYSPQNPLNSSCCGGDEKKNAMKNQADVPQVTKKPVDPIKTMADSVDASDHRIKQVVQQHAPKFEIDDELKDLFGKKEITQAMVNQLAHRALTGPMNSNNDDSPRLYTKKHCSFANEPLTIKPVTCVPGIGPVHGNLCEKQGIIMAHQLLSRYMMSANDEEFEKSLVDQLGFTPKSAAMTRDGLKEMRRHLI